MCEAPAVATLFVETPYVRFTHDYWLCVQIKDLQKALSDSKVYLYDEREQVNF